MSKKPQKQPGGRKSNSKRSTTTKRVDALPTQGVEKPDAQKPIAADGIAKTDYVARMKAPRQNELHAAAAVLQEALRQHPGDIWKQHKYFFGHFLIPSAIGRERGVSFKTKALYIEHTQYFIKELKEVNIKPKNLTHLSLKNFILCIRRWEAQGLSASSLKNRWSNGLRFLRWIGRSVPDLSVLDVVVRRKSAICKASATETKEWNHQGYDVEALIAEVEAFCPITAVRLLLEATFGLRSREALCIRPEHADQKKYLVLEHGTKGGLKRVVPIETDLQRQVLDQAKALAQGPKGLLGRRKQSLKQVRNHYYYVLRKFGITRKEKGITAHGLRHGYANNRFETLTGSPAPVNGGVQVPRDVEIAARKKISAELGHQRVQITAHYTGSVRHVRSTRTRSQNLLLAIIQCDNVVTAWTALQSELALTFLQIALFVVGPEAEGLMVKPSAALRMGVAIAASNVAALTETAAYPAEIHRAIELLSPVLKVATQRHVEIVDMRMVTLSGADTPVLKVF